MIHAVIILTIMVFVLSVTAIKKSWNDFKQEEKEFGELLLLEDGDEEDDERFDRDIYREYIELNPKK